LNLMPSKGLKLEDIHY